VVKDELIAGVDEVGRGALFGPVVAASVMLSQRAVLELRQAGVTDSKRLSVQQREHLAVMIRSLAIAHSVAAVSVEDIDRLNILQASLLAMRRAVQKLRPQPTLCRVDGNQRIPGLMIPQELVVKGDLMMIEIGAASILAKVWRDRLITRLARYYPCYDLAQNKGYGTARHRQAIQTYGISPFHRRSFNLQWKVPKS
jgi:ribonuclease HII